jgi:hypothetical protein
MIEWKRVDKDNPPEGKFLFIFDGKIFEGWTFDEMDDAGYLMWQVNEGQECYGVRWYAEINLPHQIEP